MVSLAALLVAAVVTGLRGEVRPISFRSTPRAHGLAIGLALEAVLALALIVLAIRRRRAPADAVLAARLRGVLAAAIIAGLVVIPVVLLLNSLQKGVSRHQPPVRAPTLGSGWLRRLKLFWLHLPVGSILTLLLVLVLVAAIVACVIVLRRRPGQRAEAWPAPGDDEEALRAAVESGRSALRELDDARAAIIACYLAMERSLASAGAARGAAETPDELLARAASAGLVRGEAAGQLTALFYEARFSSHPLPAAARTAAQRAIGELAASIAAQAAAAQAAAGRSAAAQAAAARPAAAPAGTGKARR
jgi:hypothetical protein